MVLFGYTFSFYFLNDENYSKMEVVVWKDWEFMIGREEILRLENVDFSYNNEKKPLVI